jgi:uncharacterized membrane protein
MTFSGRTLESASERRMSEDDESETYDPTSPKERHLGRGLFEEEMGPGSAMAHLYRGEIHRMTRWRERLDRTTNWAVTVMAAILTWAFSSPNNPHYVILVGCLMLGVFLNIEARRYRGYDMWRSRVRVLQENVFAYALDPSSAIESHDWRERLSEDYRHPRMKITFEEAVAHRLRRVYIALFTVLLGAWAFKVLVVPPADRPGWPASAAVGSVSGQTVTAVVVLAYLALLFVAFRPRRWQAKGELRDEAAGAWDDPE